MKKKLQLTDDQQILLMFQQEMKGLTDLSLIYKEKIETAKTNVKKELYTKKLKKNNEKLFNLMLFMKRHQLDSGLNADGDREESKE